ncbi:MAG: spore maturation protein, partial [Firmicutes bacterium]|nr:spore maturation protein [Bacillota bacterium]
MTTIFQWISVMFVPVLCGSILLWGILKKAPVYELFIEGVREGLEAAVTMLPFLMAIFLGLETLTASGAMGFLESLVK